MKLSFRNDLPLNQTMMFEAVYPEPLQLDIKEKAELNRAQHGIWVWMFVNDQLVGETYGVPLAELAEPVEGMSGIPADNRLYCYSNTVLPAFQHRGYGRLLKAYFLGVAKGRGFRAVYGHARPGGSQALNIEFGAKFIEAFPDWYGTGEIYKLYETVLL